jgi:hypothetical protein
VKLTTCLDHYHLIARPDREREREREREEVRDDGGRTILEVSTAPPKIYWPCHKKVYSQASRRQEKLLLFLGR